MTDTCRVFIVEDEALIAMELRDRLVSLGYTVVGTASTGERALDAIAATSLDLVLMDIKLAGQLDGIETAARLRQRTPYVPVVFVTAYSDEWLLQKASGVDAFGYLVKPFDERELHASIQIALYKHRAERALVEANAALKASNSLLSATLDSTADGILAVDIETERVTAFNRQFLELWRIPDHVIATRDSGALLRFASTQFKDPDAFLAGIARLKATPDQFLKDEVVLKDGRILERHYQPQHIDDRIVGRVFSFRDVTDRRNAERLANRAQRLEAIGTLAGGIAHDLNNALTPVLLTMDLLKQQYADESGTLEAVSHSVGHAADMVRQLLTFARGQEGNRQSVQPRRLIEGVDQIVRNTFPKNIDVQVRMQASLPNVLGDTTQLQQVLLNLCVNARDAMSTGGTLVLSATQADVAASFVHGSNVTQVTPGDYVALEVSDTGIGIPPDIVDRIFDPFFTTKGPEKGTGLGLSTASGIITGHAGFIHVDSRLGQGTTFTVYLPVGDGQAEIEAPAATDPEFSGSGELVLYVDDEGDVRQAASLVLERLRFTPVVAPDGPGGLVQAIKHREDLRVVVTDLHMPQMNGVSFVRELRRFLPTIPVIVASGRLDGPAADDFKTLGVNVVLDKPFTQQSLSAALRSVLHGDRGGSEA